jgi:hypothetical protein
MNLLNPKFDDDGSNENIVDDGRINIRFKIKREISIEDYLNLKQGKIYYFTKRNDMNTFRGKFIKLFIFYENVLYEKESVGFLFEDVEIYNDYNLKYKYYMKHLSVPFIESIYVLIDKRSSLTR